MASVSELYGNYTGPTLSTNSVIMGRDATQLDMNDFFNLLATQLSNQDMMNPQSDTEFIAQMAQFTSLAGIQNIQEYQQTSYAVSYVGKNVVIATVEENGLGITKTQGVVTNVTFYDGQPMVVVNGKSYPLYTIMEIYANGADVVGDGSDDKVTDGDGDGDGDTEAADG